ncbi:MAG: hypothetical protein PVJ57_08550 [Phycisphaerae bacterium]|jgi:hypothetical protein
MTGDSAGQPDAPSDLGEHPPIAVIETDRFCDGCGYNLRTQAIHRDPRTGILLCRCPECGRFHAAADHATTVGRLWLKRLAAALLVGWILTILAAVFGLGLVQVILCFGTLDELTYWGPGSPQQAVVSGGKLTFVSTSTSYTRWQRYVREDYEWRPQLLLLMNGLSAAAGFGVTFLAAVALAHWRRWWYLAPLVLISLGAGLIAWLAWCDDAANLEAWSRPYIASQTAAHLVGGLAGILWGRPLARGIVRVLLAPRHRGLFTYLWLADGKPPPTINS